MATVSIATACSEIDNLLQGDVFRNIKYSFVDEEDDEGVNIIEYEFPYAVIISQACDVISMSELEEQKSGKATKFMPSILLCPIYDKTIVKEAGHLADVFATNGFTLVPDKLYHSDDWKVTARDWHYRFHALTIELNGTHILENTIIDFKHCFSMATKTLLRKRADRICRLDNLFAEQLTLKFCTYISRVAIPSADE